MKISRLFKAVICLLLCFSLLGCKQSIDSSKTMDYSEVELSNVQSDYELIQKAEQANDVQSSFRSIVLKLQELIDSVWIYVVIAFSSVVAVWGAYIGIRVTVAKKNEEKINARGMVKQIAVGIIVMFVFAMGTPLVINGLSHWVTW